MKKITAIFLTWLLFGASALAEYSVPEDIGTVLLYDTNAQTESETEPETETESLSESVSLETEELLQYPELPTGCESVALTILLKYHGFYEIEKTTIADEYLPYSSNFAEGFEGDPRAENGGGCYAPAIALAARRYLDAHGSDLEVKDITGSTPEEIYRLLEQEKPVLIWTTMYFSDSIPSGVYASFNGKEYEWKFNEHCVVLTGYDTSAGTVEVNDPLEGKVTRDAQRFWSLYEDMGSMAVVIE